MVQFQTITDPTSASAALLSQHDSQRIIQQLSPTKLSEIASNHFHRQAHEISQLNIQAHLNYQLQQFDFVTDQFLSEDKAHVLVRELITIECWKEKIAPLIWPELVKFSESSFRPYFSYYHEATIVNLMEFMFYNDEMLKTEQMQDVLVDLIDYCYRKMTRLLKADAMPPIEKPSKEALMQESPSDQFKKSIQQVEFNCQMATLSIFRYITDILSELPPSVISRILDTHDMILTMVYIIEKAPWKQRGPDGYYVFSNNQWVKADPQDIHKVQQHEAQAWLAINNLLCDKESTRKYEYNNYRKDTVLRLTKYLNDLLLDQIPVLVDTQKHVSQLQIMNPPATSDSKMLYIEQISQIRNQLLKEDFETIAQEQAQEIFKPLSTEQRREETMRFSKMFDHLADLGVDALDGSGIGGEDSEYETIR